MMKKPLVKLCSDCLAEIPEGRARLCFVCTEKYKAAWRKEHTRHGTEDKRHGWLIGDLCRVTIRHVEYKAEIVDLEWVDHQNRVQLRLTKTYTDWSNQPQTLSWLHKEWVPEARLKYPLLED